MEPLRQMQQDHAALADHLQLSRAVLRGMLKAKDTLWAQLQHAERRGGELRSGVQALEEHMLRKQALLQQLQHAERMLAGQLEACVNDQRRLQDAVGLLAHAVERDTGIQVRAAGCTW